MTINYEAGHELCVSSMTKLNTNYYSRRWDFVFGVYRARLLQVAKSNFLHTWGIGKIFRVSVAIDNALTYNDVYASMNNRKHDIT